MATASVFRATGGIPGGSISQRISGRALIRSSGCIINTVFPLSPIGRECAPNARADTGRPGTSPCSATPKPIEPSGPIGTARASHCIHPDLPRGGNAPHQLNWVKNESRSERASTSRINSATAYSNVNRDFSAMAAGSHGDHDPVSVELGRNCGRSGTDDREGGRES